MARKHALILLLRFAICVLSCGHLVVFVGPKFPTTLAEFTDAKKLTTADQRQLCHGRSGLAQRHPWVFANGGELATVDGTEWTSTLSDPKTIEGLQMVHSMNASNLPHQLRDAAHWDFINDGTDGAAPEATAMLPALGSLVHW